MDIVIRSWLIPTQSFLPKVKEMIQPQKVLDVLKLDFAEKQTEHKLYSIEDERFMRNLESGI